eukprot:TRINITY_DN399_c0_g1_i1.p1 TRINITY_DN399_c0_g1~~TRINITY_DN399_c0_g1_i1.p1  ORF type:complete len:205 (-),score=53.33 TRINITY_DN399_c0_g1_i1:20-610(-)
MTNPFRRNLQPTQETNAPPLPSRPSESGAPPLPSRDQSGAPPLPSRDPSGPPPIPSRDQSGPPPVPGRQYDAPPVPGRPSDAPPVPTRSQNTPPPIQRGQYDYDQLKDQYAEELESQAQQYVGREISNAANDRGNQQALGNRVAENSDNAIVSGLARNSTVQKGVGQGVSYAAQNEHVQKKATKEAKKGFMKKLKR